MQESVFKLLIIIIGRVQACRTESHQVDRRHWSNAQHGPHDDCLPSGINALSQCSLWSPIPGWTPSRFQGPLTLIGQPGAAGIAALAGGHQGLLSASPQTAMASPALQHPGSPALPAPQFFVPPAPFMQYPPGMFSKEFFLSSLQNYQFTVEYKRKCFSCRLRKLSFLPRNHDASFSKTR